MRIQNTLTAIAALFLVAAQTAAGAAEPTPETLRMPIALIGPNVVDPAILADLDKPGDGVSCAGAGRLNFQCLVFRDDRNRMTRDDLRSNPFMVPKLSVVRQTIISDLASIHKPPFGNGESLDTGFLTYPGAKIELVGVINRMDRQFNQDIVPGHDRALACGEISAIYRFGYEGDLKAGPVGQRHYRSRLPVTMNVVFPAIPWTDALSCAEVAQRWIDYVEAVKQAAPAAAQRDKAALVVSSLQPEDIDRIELNMQGSRATAGDDNGDGDNSGTDFGSLATYIIRVFRWAPDKKGGHWQPSYLTNQIDRARLLGRDGDDNTCTENRGKRLDRGKLAAWLFSMSPTRPNGNVFPDIDNGLVNIPKDYLACRAISISPGGASRSGNQPFWKAKDPGEEILGDKEIEKAITLYKKRFPNRLSFVGNAEEFRMRLNEASCSGCHQTRAIAGFHFPGADRPGESPVNAVYLPGSSHFLGDQPRRMRILSLLAQGRSVDRRTLAASYASRPQGRFVKLMPAKTVTSYTEQNLQFIGGWGGACLIKPLARGVRDWQCASDLECKAVFDSASQPNMGMCVSKGSPKIGEVMQLGRVETKDFGFDKYVRMSPRYPPGSPRNTTIDVRGMIAPPGNSYFAAHQEYYEGKYVAPQAKVKRIARVVFATSRQADSQAAPSDCRNALGCQAKPHVRCWPQAVSPPASGRLKRGFGRRRAAFAFTPTTPACAHVIRPIPAGMTMSA